LFYPSVQANYEFTKGLNVKKVIKKNTDVNSLLLGPGIDFYYKSFSINASWQFTVAEKAHEGNLKSVGRISVGINYSFGKREKGWFNYLLSEAKAKFILNRYLNI